MTLSYHKPIEASNQKVSLNDKKIGKDLI